MDSSFEICSRRGRGTSGVFWAMVNRFSYQTDLEPFRELDFAHIENAMKIKMKNRSVA